MLHCAGGIGGIIASFLITMVRWDFPAFSGKPSRAARARSASAAPSAQPAANNGQILIEVALLSTLAVVVGVLVIAQLPLLGVFRFVSVSAFSIGLAGALATIYGLTLLCGVYPSWLAGRVQPAQALHYE